MVTDNEMKRFLEQTEIIVARDQRNLRILRSDQALTKEIVPACDCYDLISFLHILNPSETQDNAYDEGIRRYFVGADKLILTPAWTIELLNYIRKVMIDNIEEFGGNDGFNTFMKQYPEAAHFLALWKTKKYREAERLFDGGGKWTQVLSFTKDTELDILLGQTIRRFNQLVDEGLFKAIGDYLDPKDGVMSHTATFDATMAKLTELRPGSYNRTRNAIDAKSLATIRWANLQDSDKYFTAVTASRNPLIAFYDALDTLGLAPGEEKASDSLARSSIYAWLGELVSACAKDRQVSYLDGGLSLCHEILTLITSLNSLDSSFESSFDPTPSPERIKNNILKGELGGLLETYQNYYRERIFKPIERLGRKKKERRGFLTAQEVAKVLTAEPFEKAMKEARKSLESSVKEMVEKSEPFVRTSSNELLLGQSLESFYTSIADDLSRDVF